MQKRAVVEQAVFDALASPVRREVLWLTWDQERSVGELGRHFEISGPTLSSHLAALRAAGLVHVRVDGNHRRYRCDQTAVRSLLPLLAVGDDRWRSADDIPERDLADSSVVLGVVVDVEVDVPPAEAFAAFADGERYSAWLGAPVRIDDGSFQATMEWGTEVRGTYEVIAPPELIAMRWDFDDDAVPVPGQAHVAYLRVHPTDRGSRVEVHQLCADEQAAAWFSEAWRLVLGRFSLAHTTDSGPAPVRAKRPKHRG